MSRIVKPGDTAEDRYIISFEMGEYIGQLERIHTIMTVLWEDYFGVVRDTPPGEYEYNLIGDYIFLLSDNLFHIITEMALCCGDTTFRGAQIFIERAKAAERAVECSALVDKARDVQRKVTSEAERQVLKSIIDGIAELPDGEALPKIKAFLKEHGKEVSP